jgi:hypothetical protein
MKAEPLLFIDAIEGATARLLLGVEAFNVPVRLLPAGSKEGNWVRVSFEVAPAPRGDQETDALRRKLGRDDDGGDIKL